MAISQEATVTLNLIAKDLASGNIQKVATGLSGLQKTGGLAGTALKGAGVLAAGGFGLMTAGAIQAQDAQGKFMAATGASRDEAKAFVSSMDGIAGSAGTVGMSFDQIAKVGTDVANQFGTTGQATADLTNQFSAFAKVTGQDADQAVLGINDAMTAFGEPASKAQADLDLLIASHQKFGTDVGPQTIQTLQNMAPALQVLGGDFSDGVGLMNAFESAGVNSNTAMKDLATSIKKFPPGTTFNDIITQLGAIQDPAARAQKAVELFGAKAGPSLAKVIQPGMTSLDDFKVSATDAAGATDKAAGAMETDAQKFQGFVDKVGAGARELGQQFGPAITGLASVGSLASSFGGSKIVGAMVSGIKGLLGKVAGNAEVKVASAAIGAAEGEAESAAATGSKVLASFLQKFGLMTGEKVAASTAAGVLEGEAEGTAAAEAASGPGILAKFTTGGGLAGAAMGAGLIVGVAALATIVGPAAVKAGDDIGRTVFGGMATAMGSTVEKGILSGTIFDSLIDGMHSAIAGVENTALFRYNIYKDGQWFWMSPETGQQITTQVTNTLAGEFGSHAAWAPVGNAIATGAQPAFQHAAQAVADTAKPAFGFAGGASGDAFTAGLASHIASERGDEQAAADKAKADARAFILGVYDNKDAAKQSWQTFIDEMNHPLDAAKETAWIKGKLASKRLQDGLHSSDPVIRAQAEAEYNALTARMNDLVKVYGDKGGAASSALQNSLNDNYFEAQREASNFVSNFNDILSGIEKNRTVHVGVTYHDTGGGTGGGRALGGPVGAHTMYEVNERGAPELLQVGERTFLMMGDRSGQVAPIDHGGRSQASFGGGSFGSGKELHVHLHLDSVVPPTGSQMAEAARAFVPELTREMRRQRLLPSGGF